MAIKITNFIIAALFVAFFAVVITVFTAGAYEQTGETGEGNLTFLDKTKNLTLLIEKTENASKDISGGSALDLIGAYLVSASDAVKISVASGKVVNEMTTEGLAELPGSGITTQLKIIITASLTVLLVIGVVVAIFVKRDL